MSEAEIVLAIVKKFLKKIQKDLGDNYVGHSNKLHNGKFRVYVAEPVVSPKTTSLKLSDREIEVEYYVIGRISAL